MTVADRVSPTVGVQLLIDFINSLNLTKAVDKKFDHTLSKLLVNQVLGDQAGTCQELGKFIDTIKKETGKKLTVDEANQLLAATDPIKSALGCP